MLWTLCVWMDEQMNESCCWSQFQSNRRRFLTPQTPFLLAALHFHCPDWTLSQYCAFNRSKSFQLNTLFILLTVFRCEVIWELPAQWAPSRRTTELILVQNGDSDEDDWVCSPSLYSRCTKLHIIMVVCEFILFSLDWALSADWLLKGVFLWIFQLFKIFFPLPACHT